MQHLVASETKMRGPMHFDAPLAQAPPRPPFFGERTLTPELHKVWQTFYRDVAVLAMPTPTGDYRLPDIDEKALYLRAPYSSQPGVKPFLTADRTILPPERCIAASKVLDVTDKLSPEGRLVWDIPEGNWTILRFGRTVTGQTTRPAPTPGLGFESDKFDTAALDAHFEAFIGTLLATVGRPAHPGRGLTTVHFDSWEMSSQNWSERFREEFRQRRGYDLLRYLPVMLGHVVESVAVSERFLWDLRRTAQELVVENHAFRLKELGRRHGLTLSIEPYDLNPAGDLALGGAADVPMCEFWSKGFGFATEFSCFEAVSIAHTQGRPIVAAEAFTSTADAWRQHPASMKPQGDWALCAGINRIVFHRYQHQPWLDRFPGLTFGPHGVHWERTQTWWELAPAYHTYLARCQTLLRRGRAVADVLYLDAEGAPQVFRPPVSATLSGLPDRRGYNFDGCAPGTLIERASMRDGRIAFPDGVSYRLLVLPRLETMTPAVLKKIKQLVEDGATVLGSPPRQSPSLENFPQCDAEVQQLSADIWRNSRVLTETPAAVSEQENTLETAKWIWYPEGHPAARAPVGKRYFRREWDLPGEVAAATFVMTADNSFELFVNGRSAGTGDNFHQQYALDVTALLKAGKNVLTVTAENGGDAPNPAGWIGALTVQLRDDRKLRLITDGDWTSSLTPDGERRPAVPLGAWSMAPWHLAKPTIVPELYPSYDTTAQMLAKMGIPPDFESSADLRYIHRHDEHAEIYFVGNRTNAPVSAECRFRVTGLQPELWDAVTSERRTLPEFREEHGRTVVPLRFAPSESYFVVFRKGSRASGVNFPDWKPAAELAGPWEVTFDPQWGGPDQPVTFTSLSDWTQRPEDDIRHYSGVAVYRTTLDAPAAASLQSRPSLDLGEVKDLAAVKLNGRELGVVWCAPWRVVLPAGLLKPAGNQLEIKVANLWPNRLIKDASLPEKQRLTWTTWSPYKPSDRLLPSGLLGPVRILLPTPS
jgi:hypothetical protein